MVDLKCSPLSNWPERGCHLQAHLQCLQHQLESIASSGRHRPQLLHTDKLPAHLGDHPLSFQQNDFSRQCNCARQMWHGLRICLHYQIVLMANSMQMLRVMIHRNWAGLKAKPPLTWSKWNSPWSNLRKGWGSPTWVLSTSGRKNRWWGFSGRSIGPLSRDTTVWNSRHMDSRTGIWRQQIVWRLLRPGWFWQI